MGYPLPIFLVETLIVCALESSIEPMVDIAGCLLSVLYK